MLKIYLLSLWIAFWHIVKWLGHPPPYFGCLKEQRVTYVAGCEQAALINYCSLGGLNNMHSFLTVWRIEQFKIKVSGSSALLLIFSCNCFLISIAYCFELHDPVIMGCAPYLTQLGIVPLHS